MSVRRRRLLWSGCLLALLPVLAHADSGTLDLRLEVASGRFAGVLGVADARGAAAQWSVAGEAAPGVAHGQDVLYPVASVTKPVIAVAVMRLVEQGRLGLHDRLDMHWAPARGRPAGKVSIAQLLNHQSGIPSVLHTGQDLDETLDESQWPLPTTAMAQLERVLEMPLRFEPGSRYEYNNSSYLILGELLAQLTGQPMAQAVSELALAPAGIAGEACFCESLPGLETARPRELAADGSVRDAVDMHPTRGGAAGGLRITPRALLAWGQALLQGRVLKPETLERMWADGLATRRAGETMGMGWLVREEEGQVLHDGTMPGVTSTLALDRRNGRVAVGMLSPTLPLRDIARSEDYVGERTAALAAGRRPHWLPGHGVQDALALAGAYRLPGGGVLQVARNAEGWRLELAEGSPLQLAQGIVREGARQALSVVASWAGGGQAALLPRMAAGMREALPAGALDAAWASWVEGKGAYAGAHVYAVSPSGASARLRLRFARGHVDLGMVFDEDDLVEGLQLLGEDRASLPRQATALLTDDGRLWLDGYRHGVDPVILRPRVEDGRVAGLWIGMADVDGAFLPRIDVASSEL